MVDYGVEEAHAPDVRIVNLNGLVAQMPAELAERGPQRIVVFELLLLLQITLMVHVVMLLVERVGDAVLRLRLLLLELIRQLEAASMGFAGSAATAHDR